MVSRAFQADVDAVLSHRHDNGADFWASPDGKLGVGGPFSTLESLLVLSELRVPRTHEAVKGATGLVLDACRDDGRVKIAPKGTMYPCHAAIAMSVLCRFGHGRNARVRRVLEQLLETRHDDGGWRCNKAPGSKTKAGRFSNPGVTLFVLDAFRCVEGAAGDGELDDAVETLLDHWTVRRPIGPCSFGIGTLFMQVEYPFLRYNLFFYTYVLSFYGKARGDPRYHEALSALEEKLDDRGRVVVERPHRRLASFAMCARGEPSTPATRRHREIVKNMGG